MDKLSTNGAGRGRRTTGAEGSSQAFARPSPRMPGASYQRSSSALLDYYRTLSRHRGLILATAALGIVASFLLNLTTLPVYQARTSIEVQTLNGDFMNMRAVAPTSDSGANSGDAFLQTQVKLLQSDTLLEHTAARLQAEPHPAFIERNDMLSQWKRGLHLSHSEPLAYKDLVENAVKGAKVKPAGMTKLIEVTCDSWDPAFSAKFCNTLITEFQEEDLQARGSEAQKTSDWLTRQAEDVRLKAEASQKKLEASVGGDGLMLSQDTNTVGEDRLREIQGELVRAQADRMEKEAQTAIASSSSADTVPGIADRPSYQVYQQKLSDLRAQVAQLVPPLTEENPKVIHLRSQIREVEGSLSRESTSDTGRMKNEYDAARHREALLAATYNAAKSNVSASLNKAGQVSLLRREVEGEQQLYQSLLGKAKEAGFASAMQASTIHVVDAARSPKLPILPRRGSSEAGGLLIGSLFGVGMAFFKDRNFDVLRLPGDSTRYLHVQELGVIPSAFRAHRNLGHTARLLGRTITGHRNPAPEIEAPRQNAIGLARWGDNFSIVAEAYRNATLSILLSEMAERRSQTFVVASPNASDGKTSVTSNLGVALSRSKLRVLLIDGDLRRPGLHTALGVSNDYGLRDLLRKETPLDAVTALTACKPSGLPNLWILPSGTGDEEAVELLHSRAVADLLAQLNGAFDVVLIDTPPVLHMADARLFAGHADGVILVFRSSVTMRDEAASALELFERDRVHVIGTILNDFNPGREGQGSYYRSYYRYKDQLGVKEAAEEPEEVGARS